MFRIAKVGQTDCIRRSGGPPYTNQMSNGPSGWRTQTVWKQISLAVRRPPFSLCESNARQSGELAESDCMRPDLIGGPPSVSLYNVDAKSKARRVDRCNIYFSLVISTRNTQLLGHSLGVDDYPGSISKREYFAGVTTKGVPVVMEISRSDALIPAL